LKPLPQRARASKTKGTRRYKSRDEVEA